MHSLSILHVLHPHISQKCYVHIPPQRISLYRITHAAIKTFLNVIVVIVTSHNTCNNFPRCFNVQAMYICVFQLTADAGLLTLTRNTNLVSAQSLVCADVLHLRADEHCARKLLHVALLLRSYGPDPRTDTKLSNDAHCRARINANSACN